MFGIKIDGQWADLKPGDKIKLARWNGIFDLDEIRGSLVNDYGLPFTPKNDKIFGWFRETGMRFPNKQYYCEKVADGYVIERGYIELVDCTEEEYVVVFTQNLSEVFGEFQNILLNRLLLGSVALPGSPVKDANHLTDAFCWPTVNNASFYGTNTQAGWNGKMNEWAGSVLNANARVPMLFMRYLFERIGTLTGYSFKGSFFESDIFLRGVVFNTFSLDDAADIFYANHLPEVTIVEFVKELRRLLNLVVYFDVNTKTMYAYYIDEILKRPTVLNWTNKIVPNNARTPERNNRLQLDWELDQNDAIMKTVPLPTGFGYYQTPETSYGNVVEIKSKISTVHVVAGVATVDQIGVSGRFSQGGAKFGLRIALWNGLVGGVPTISNSYGSWRLAWSGADNLRDKCFAELEKVKANTAYKTVMANLTALDLTNIDWHNNENAEHSVYVKGRAYYVTQVECLLPLEGLSQLWLVEKP